MSKFFKILFLLFFAVFLLNGIAMADAFNIRSPQIGVNPGYGTEDDLQEILDNIIVNDSILAQGDQSPAAVWSMTDANTTAWTIAVFTANGGTFGIYSFADGTAYDLSSFTTSPIDPVDGSFAGNTSITIDASSSGLRIGSDPTLHSGNFSLFGFYWDYQGTKVYTEDSRNGGDASALAYRVAGGTEIDPDVYWDIATYGTKPNFYALDGDDWIIAFDNYTNSDDFNDSLPTKVTFTDALKSW